MTITTREEAMAAMEVFNDLEACTDINDREALYAAMERQDEILEALDLYFQTDEQRAAINYLGTEESCYREALRLGVDPVFARWFYLSTT